MVLINYCCEYINKLKNPQSHLFSFDLKFQYILTLIRRFVNTLITSSFVGKMITNAYQSATCWRLCGAKFIWIIFQIYAIYWTIIFLNSWFTNTCYIKVDFCSIYEIFKFFNIIKKRTCVNIKEVQSIFMVPITNTLNFINVIIRTVNDIFSVFILLRRKFSEFIEEVT